MLAKASAVLLLFGIPLNTFLLATHFLEYLEAVQVCAMRRHLQNLVTVHSLFSCILWTAGPICIYLLSFCSL